MTVSPEVKSTEPKLTEDKLADAILTGEIADPESFSEYSEIKIKEQYAQKEQKTPTEILIDFIEGKKQRTVKSSNDSSKQPTANNRRTIGARSVRELPSQLVTNP